MSNIPYLVTDKSLTFYLDFSKPTVVDRSAATFNDLVAELNKPNPNRDRLVELSNVASAIEAKVAAVATQENYLTKGVFTVDRSGVYYNGVEIHGTLSDRLMDVLAAGLRLGPWIRFAENLYQNPAEHAREELYDWLAASDLPITEDGHFLAYKVVQENYTDVYTGTFDNSVGQIVQLENRSKVDPNRDRHCSVGLHFCSKSYLPSFGAYGSGRRVVIVKINPADVVSIPSDYQYAKGRTWRYEVVDEIDASEIDLKTWDPVYDYDESYDDYDDYDVDLEDEFDEDLEEELEDLDEIEAEVAAQEAEEAYREELSALGIVELRRRASAAELKNAWKGYSKDELIEYLLVAADG